jgi:pantetheine-phosphate adenylyltransferase
MKSIAVFAGSFDPFTVGHEDIVTRALAFLDEIIIAVGENGGKRTRFSVDTRVALARKVFRDEPRVRVDSYSGLTVKYCRQVGATLLLRGARSAADFEYERGMEQVNRALDPGIETLFLFASPRHIAISSSVVKEVLLHGGDLTPFLPTGITPADLGILAR